MAKSKKELEVNTKSKKELELEEKVSNLENVIKSLTENLTKLFQDNNKLSIDKEVVKEEVKNKEIPKEKKTNDNKNRTVAPFGQFIPIMSLTNHQLTLTPGSYDKEDPFDFMEFGEIQQIVYDKLAKIIQKHKNLAKNGNFYIMDEDVIRLHNLEKDYEKILDKDTILNILELDNNTIEKLFKNTTKTIQDTIISIIINKIIDGEDVDHNKIYVLSRIYGKDINNIINEIKDTRINQLKKNDE